MVRLGGRRPRCDHRARAGVSPCVNACVSEHSRVFSDRPASRGVRGICVDAPRHVLYQDDSFGLQRPVTLRSLAPRARPVARRAGRVRVSHSHGAQWPFSASPVASGLRGAHTVHDTQTQSQNAGFRVRGVVRGVVNPLNCCALALRPAPAAWPLATLWYAISYDLQWHRAVNEQSLRHGCYIHARLRRAFELFDYDNTTLHLPVRSHPVPRRSHRPHTAPPCICIRAEADPSIALRCTAES